MAVLGAELVYWEQQSSCIGGGAAVFGGEEVKFMTSMLNINKSGTFQGVEC